MTVIFLTSNNTDVCLFPFRSRSFSCGTEEMPFFSTSTENVKWFFLFTVCFWFILRWLQTQNLKKKNCFPRSFLSLLNWNLFVKLRRISLIVCYLPRKFTKKIQQGFTFILVRNLHLVKRSDRNYKNVFIASPQANIDLTDLTVWLFLIDDCRNPVCMKSLSGGFSWRANVFTSNF